MVKVEPESLLVGRLRESHSHEWRRYRIKADIHVWHQDYVALFMPYIPGITPKRFKNLEMPFFGANERLPILLMILLGLQHAFAMLGGLIVPPLLLGSGAGLSGQTMSYLVSSALIWCVSRGRRPGSRLIGPKLTRVPWTMQGLGTWLQVSSIKLPFGYRLGSSLLTVTGTSFAFIGSALGFINAQYAPGGMCQ